MKIALLDDSKLFRQGLASLLVTMGHEIPLETHDQGRLLCALKSLALDVVVIDIRMPPSFTDEGLCVGRKVRAVLPTMPLVFLSTYSEVEYAAAALDLGGHAPCGYLIKDRLADVSAFERALRSVCSGECVIDGLVVEQLMLARSRQSLQLDRLTDSERNVLQLIAEGCSNVSIAARLTITTKTVEGHISNVFAKLHLTPGSDVNRRVLAVLRWLDNGATKL